MNFYDTDFNLNYDFFFHCIDLVNIYLLVERSHMFLIFKTKNSKNKQIFQTVI